MPPVHPRIPSHERPSPDSVFSCRILYFYKAMLFASVSPGANCLRPLVCGCERVEDGVVPLCKYLRNFKQFESLAILFGPNDRTLGGGQYPEHGSWTRPGLHKIHVPSPQYSQWPYIHLNVEADDARPESCFATSYNAGGAAYAVLSPAKSDEKKARGRLQTFSTIRMRKSLQPEGARRFRQDCRPLTRAVLLCLVLI
jgi:hypothetical protein